MYGNPFSPPNFAVKLKNTVYSVSEKLSESVWHLHIEVISPYYTKRNVDYDYVSFFFNQISEENRIPFSPRTLSKPP